MADLHDRTEAIYNARARAWDSQRNRAFFEKIWMDRMLVLMPEKARVLDLGCGSGEPMARYLMEHGHAVTGVDFAEGMLEICRERWPDGDWLRADMRGLALDRTFDAILAWNSFFHLNREEQRAMFATFAMHLEPGGVLLFTSGDADGEVTGTVDGEAVYHASLSPEEYRAEMAAEGLNVLRFIPRDPDCNFHSIWLAEKLR